jgi:hypothetical protein
LSRLLAVSQPVTASVRIVSPDKCEFDRRDMVQYEPGEVVLKSLAGERRSWTSDTHRADSAVADLLAAADIEASPRLSPGVRLSDRGGLTQNQGESPRL